MKTLVGVETNGARSEYQEVTAEIHRYLRAKSTVVFQNVLCNLRSAVVLTFPQILDVCAVIPSDN